MELDNVTPFGRTKTYQHFGELLKDAAKDFSDIKSGIIVLFNEESGIKIMPVCTLAQLAFAAGRLLHGSATGEVEYDK